MASPARDIRNKIQEQWPGAIVVNRGRHYIQHQHPADPNKFSLDVSVGPLHYGPSTDQEIDTAWEADVGVWQHRMISADYQVRAKSSFNGAPLLEYRIGEDWVTLQPRQLDWHNDRGDVQVAGNIQGVSSIVSDDVLRWDDAYGTGRHFEYEAQTARLAKKIILDSYSSLPAPSSQILTGGNPVLRSQFQFAWSSTLSVFVDGTEWTGGGGSPTLTTADAIEFRHADGSVAFVFRSPTAYDAQDAAAPGMLLRVSRSGPNVLVEVRTPQPWLENASYPVTIDPTVDEQVAASGDDGNYYDSSSFLHVDANTCIIGHEGSNGISAGHYALFVTDVPQGATIDAANLTYRSNNNDSGTTVNVAITAADEDNASAPSSYTDATTRTRTTASVSWSSIASWSVVTDYDSPDIASVIQEIVDRAGWSTGNNLVIFVDDNGTTQDSGSARRRGKSYDSSTTLAPKLHVEYTEGGGDVTLTADHGSFALNGQAQTFAITMPSEHGSYS